jgi:DNA polymerase III subunit delta
LSGWRFRFANSSPYISPAKAEHAAVVKVAPRSVGRFVQKPDESAAAVLIFGADRGQVTEIAATLVHTISGDVHDPFRVAELTVSAIGDDPALLGDEARAISLTGGRRVVRVRGATDPVAKPLAEYLTDPVPNSVIVLEAGELPTRSALRKLTESHARAAAIACYPDEGASLSALAKEVLDARQVRIAPDALRFVTAQLGADRQASRNALEKLSLFVGSGNTATLDDAMAVIGDVSESTMDQLATAVVAGKGGEAQRLLQRLYGEGTATVAIVRALARHFGRMAEARHHVDAGMDADAAVGKLRPPVFFRAKPAMVAAVNIWNSQRLANALDRLLRVEIDCKTTGMPDQLICARAVLALSMAAPRVRR